MKYRNIVVEMEGLAKTLKDDGFTVEMKHGTQFGSVIRYNRDGQKGYVTWAKDQWAPMFYGDLQPTWQPTEEAKWYERLAAKIQDLNPDGKVEIQENRRILVDFDLLDPKTMLDGFGFAPIVITYLGLRCIHGGWKSKKLEHPREFDAFCEKLLLNNN